MTAAAPASRPNVSGRAVPLPFGAAAAHTNAFEPPSSLLGSVSVASPYHGTGGEMHRIDAEERAHHIDTVAHGMARMPPRPATRSAPRRIITVSA